MQQFRVTSLKKTPKKTQGHKIGRNGNKDGQPKVFSCKHKPRHWHLLKCLKCRKSRRHILWHRGTKIIKLHSHIKEEKTLDGQHFFFLYLVTKPVRVLHKESPLLPRPCLGRLYRIKACVSREHPMAAAIMRNTLYKLNSFIRYYKHMPAADSGSASYTRLCLSHLSSLLSFPVKSPIVKR